MVGAVDVLQDEGILEPRSEGRGDAEVVDAPPMFLALALKRYDHQV
jgi:hypothetical protein